MGDRPLGRAAGLVVDSIGDELLVYDTESRRAHSLNTLAAAVWRACDGQRDVDQLAELTGFDRNAVELALNNLADVALISGYQTSGISRRVVLRRLSLTAAGLAVGLPVIRSITAPTAAMAYPAKGGDCTSQDCGPGSFCDEASSCHAGSALAMGATCVFGAGTCNFGSYCNATSLKCTPVP